MAVVKIGGMIEQSDSVRKPKGLLAARQLVLVTTPGWEAVDGQLRRYERGKDDRWSAVGGTTPIVVGRTGLAWAPAFYDAMPALIGKSDPVKKEGDGKSPAGIFTLSSAFGYADPNEASAIRLPYLQATSTLECVDDSRSTHYNRLVDRNKVREPDWSSSEQMRRSDEQYRWGVVVDHNYPATKPGCGSCIFLHIWTGRGHGTAGCTAMEADKMKELLFWLDPAKKPVMIQLTDEDYRRLRKPWQLP